MDLRKVKDDEKLTLCRRYYYGGFALLPLLWIVNFVWFFGEAFRRAPFAEQKQIRTYVVRSALGAVFWIIVLLAWNIYFQLNRASLSWGDYMSFIIPTGIP
ncbi:membrane protein-like protein [Leptotrombidium deliense]|uniref:Gamma-secretase subunit PEN-2 n=1 Tax=Leptotrombidium deliense TaxID=299467 RepID=A0A443SQ43_9ACAR|nr:membrane protein-like protein [Leptotrombidium deliense]